nr:hypothetical protein Itr_chr11CG07160 [Ipomoea trifida]
MRTNDRRETDNDAINSDFWKQDLNAKPQIQSNRIPMLHVSGPPPLHTLYPIGGRPHGPPFSPPATFVPSGRAEHRGTLNRCLGFSITLVHHCWEAPVSDERDGGGERAPVAMNGTTAFSISGN